VESNAFLRARFWPVRKSSFHALLAGEGAVDAPAVAALGVDVKGLFALERLFWEQVSEPVQGVLFETRPERARSLALSLAQDITTHAESAAKLLGGGSRFVRKFAKGGQQNVALLVTQLVQSVEAIVADRLDRVLGLHKNGRLKPGELLGDFSGLSTQLTCVSLREIRTLYLGASDDGLSALVKQAAPDIDAHLRTLLADALRATEAIGAPLERAVLNAAGSIESARDRVKALELAFKVELPSALGVTLSIAAGDGD
jgi:predicted lipoprotein